MDPVKRKLYGTVMEETILQAPPRPSRDEKRETILKIAYEAFLADGYAATSMSSIAAKVGGSKATLYNYFPSKQDLFVAVIDEKCQEVQALLIDLELDPADFRTALIHMGEGLLRMVLSDSRIATFRLITAETGRFPELGQAFYQSGPLQSQQRLSRFFERAIADGKLTPGDTFAMAGRFFSLVKGELHHRRLWGVMAYPDNAEIEAHVDEAVRIFLEAYGTEPASH